MASTASDWFPMHRDIPDPDAVFVCRSEYDRLTQISHQYASLRENLIRGGVTNETVDLLSNITAANQAQSTTTTAERPQPATHVIHTSRPARDYHHIRRPPPSHTTPELTKADKSFENESPGTQTPIYNGNGQENYESEYDDCEKPRQMLRHADRTLLFSNLPEGTTHADVTAVVRCGMLLDVFMRHKKHAATVSFLYQEDASEYFAHVQKHDLYVNNKRVEVSWDNRQFTLPPHMCHKINIGATRNLVIKRYKGEHDAQEIIDDLDHIYNLTVVKVDFIGNNCFISTNSVNGAAFARTCMMSRLKYRGSRIEFDADECAQPFVRPVQKKVSPEPFAKTSASAMNMMGNRFHVLDMED